MEFASIAHLFADVDAKENTPKASEKPKDDVLAKVRKLISDSGVSVEAVEQVVVDKGHYEEGSHIEDYAPDFITRWVIPNFKKIIETIKNKNGGNN